ncbi:MAG: GNAT family N-acetyltransferase [Pseudomonadota bacterium]
MTRPSPAQSFKALETTWPASEVCRVGPWTLRRGDGGGKRVSAATALGPVGDVDIAAAESGMRAWDQVPLFMVRSGEEVLDNSLENRGYPIVDPVFLYCNRVAEIASEQPLTASMPSWPPLATQREIWNTAGIGAARQAVMERCGNPKTTLLGRFGDVPAGTAFVGIVGDMAMVHAIEVLPRLQRTGVGRHLMQGAANWAADKGADWLCLAVTQENVAANALYQSLGMEVVTRYHYRRAPEVAI